MQREHNSLKIIHVWWKDASAPCEVFLARVVSIFKKGSSDDPAKCGPISLLNNVYEFYLFLIKQQTAVHPRG